MGLQPGFLLLHVMKIYAIKTEKTNQNKRQLRHETGHRCKNVGSCHTLCRCLLVCVRVCRGDGEAKNYLVWLA